MFPQSRKNVGKKETVPPKSRRSPLTRTPTTREFTTISLSLSLAPLSSRHSENRESKSGCAFPLVLAISLVRVSPRRELFRNNPLVILHCHWWTMQRGLAESITANDDACHPPPEQQLGPESFSPDFSRALPAHPYKTLRSRRETARDFGSFPVCFYAGLSKRAAVVYDNTLCDPYRGFTGLPRHTHPGANAASVGH